MPTGVPIRDARQQLFDAAERVLLRAGPNALTSRAVTTEAGVAKGLVHRYFADFDTLLAELVLDRVARAEALAKTLAASAGSGTVGGNLSGALAEFFSPVAVGIVGLFVTRDGVRERLRDAGLARIPLLTHGAAMVGAYLTAERDNGRVAADADIAALAPALIGAVHLLYADHGTGEVPLADVRRVVDAVTGSLTTA